MGTFDVAQEFPMITVKPRINKTKNNTWEFQIQN
jgi:hypothetical protein